jgi:hypothetical protein
MSSIMNMSGRRQSLKKANKDLSTPGDWTHWDRWEGYCSKDDFFKATNVNQDSGGHLQVLWRRIDCFLFGRRSSNCFDMRTLAGERICASAQASCITPVGSLRSLLLEKKRSGSSFCGKTAGCPPLKLL